MPRHEPPPDPGHDAALPFGLAQGRTIGITVAGIVLFTVLAVLAESRWRPLEHLDADVARTCHAWVSENGARKRTILILSNWLWDPFAFRGAVLILCVWLWRRSERRRITWAVVAMILAVGFSALAKLVFDRPRPEGMTVTAPGGSFPSGHVMTGLVGTGVLLLALLPHLSRAGKAVARALAAATVLGVGATRVVLGAHYLSDVVAGLILGTVILFGTSLAFARHAATDAKKTDQKVPSRR